MRITESRACNAPNSKSSVPAQHTQSQARDKRTTTHQVPLGLTQVGRPPMEEGTMSTLQIWQALQGRSDSLDWLASKITSENETSDANACIAPFFATCFPFVSLYFHTNTEEEVNIFKHATLSRRQSSVQQSSSSSYSTQQQQSGQQSWQQASGGFNARQVKKTISNFLLTDTLARPIRWPATQPRDRQVQL